MKIYDNQGRLKISVDSLGDVLDSRYLRRDASGDFEDGLTIGFEDSNTNVKFYNGQIYIQNETDGKYYQLRCATTDNVVSFFPGDVGITL